MTAPTLTADRIRADVAELLGCDPTEVTDEENLTERGLDSMRMMSLIERWRDAGANLEFPDLAETPQLGHWTKLLEAV